MKKLNAILLCLFSAMAVNAQYAGVYAGVAIPAGDFDNKDYIAPRFANTAFAKQGYALGLTGSFLLPENLALCLDIGYATFGFDASAYARIIQNKEANTIASLNASDYHYTHMLIGISPRISIKKVAFNLRLMLGVANGKSPDLTLTRTVQYYNGGSYSTFDTDFFIKGREQMDFIVAWGLSGDYHLNRSLYIVAGIDNIISANFLNWDNTIVPYLYFKPTIGLGVAFNNKSKN